MKLLITGAGGFVGGHLAAHLRQCYPEADLHGTILSDAERRPTFDSLGCALSVVDFRDPESVRFLLARLQPDRIYHLAGQAFVPRSFEAPWETLEINVRGALNIFESIRALGLSSRVLVIGSADVYGIVKPEAIPLREESPLLPASPYGVSKAAQDLLAAQYARSFGQHLVRVRPFNHIGPGQNVRFAASDWAMQIAEAEIGKREPVVLVGDLSAARDFTDVRDVVRAYVLALEQGTPGDVFNVCRGVSTRMETILQRLTGMSTIPIEVRPVPERMRPAEIPILQGDPSHLQERTGWQPQISLEQSLSDILGEWRQWVRAKSVSES